MQSGQTVRPCSSPSPSQSIDSGSPTGGAGFKQRAQWASRGVSVILAILTRSAARVHFRTGPLLANGDSSPSHTGHRRRRQTGTAKTGPPVSRCMRRRLAMSWWSNALTPAGRPAAPSGLPTLQTSGAGQLYNATVTGLPRARRHRMVPISRSTNIRAVAWFDAGTLERTWRRT